MVPVGERALAWLDLYLNGLRPEIVRKPDNGIVFLTTNGVPFTPNHLSWLARQYVKSAGIGKGGACHIFRHTLATLMLEGGADIRYIQAMLGHVRLDTTQVYTHVSIRMLKQVHAATHPAARLNSENDQFTKLYRSVHKSQQFLPFLGQLRAAVRPARLFARSMSSSSFG